jgi:hypothetical protein
MGETPIPRRVLEFVSATVYIACSFAAAASGPDPAALTAVELIDINAGSCRISLSIRGGVNGVEGFRLEDGRFVFDLEGVAWSGPTRRVSPDVPGIHEYRYSQFSREPLVTRIVIEADADWSCRPEPFRDGLLLACSGPPGPEAHAPADPDSTIAVVRGISLTSPIAGLDAEELIDRSLGFTPRDMVRDGLPNFGSMRDDWKGAPRRHEGLDIYGDKMVVQAVAEGKIVGIGYGDRAGGWATVRHGNGVETLYVHISDLRVKTGDSVARGQNIAAIDGAVGNAVQPQLHFELRLDNRSVDPVSYILVLASEDLKRKIRRANQRLEILERERAARVRSGIE